MSTPDNNKKPIEEVQELTDENLDEVSGGMVTLSSALQSHLARLVSPVD
jgi:hypothetical protein